MTTSTWTSRSRVETALAHREADRVPYDLGGTILTGINHHAYRRLRRHLGLPEEAIEIEDKCQQLGRVHEDVKERLRVDVWGINPGRAPGAGRRDSLFSMMRHPVPCIHFVGQVEALGVVIHHDVQDDQVRS